MSASVTAIRPTRNNESAQSDAHDDMPELVGADYVMRRSGLSKPGVYLLARQGRLGGVVRVGRNVRFDRAKFEAWFRENCEMPLESERAA